MEGLNWFNGANLTLNSLFFLLCLLSVILLLDICVYYLNRGPCKCAHDLLNLINDFGERDKMRVLLGILSLFRNEFNKFKNTAARMFDFIYNMTLKLLIFACFRFAFVGVCSLIPCGHLVGKG